MREKTGIPADLGGIQITLGTALTVLESDGTPVKRRSLEYYCLTVCLNVFSLLPHEPRKLFSLIQLIFIALVKINGKLSVILSSVKVTKMYLFIILFSFTFFNSIYFNDNQGAR